MSLVVWEKAPEEVVKLARDIIDDFHPHLQDARIGLLFRAPTPISMGRPVLGKASLVTARWRPLLREDLDFIIWLSSDYWHYDLDESQRRALLDHELNHCAGHLDEWKMRGHDIEEFNIIIRRYGHWSPAIEDTARAIFQVGLGLDGTDLLDKVGKVTAVTLSSPTSNTGESVTLH